VPEPKKTPSKGMAWLLAGAAMLGFLFSGAAPGQQFCSEPVSPYCADPDSQYETMVQINRCKEDVASYEEELNDYEACIEESLERMRSDLEEARENLDKAEEQF